MCHGPGALKVCGCAHDPAYDCMSALLLLASGPVFGPLIRLAAMCHSTEPWKLYLTPAGAAFPIPLQSPVAACHSAECTILASPPFPFTSQCPLNTPNPVSPPNTPTSPAPKPLPTISACTPTVSTSKPGQRSSWCLTLQLWVFLRTPKHFSSAP